MVLGQRSQGARVLQESRLVRGFYIEGGLGLRVERLWLLDMRRFSKLVGACDILQESVDTFGKLSPKSQPRRQFGKDPSSPIYRGNLFSPGSRFWV